MATEVDRLRSQLAMLASLPESRAQSLPPEFYTSEAWLEAERQGVFRREWICVGRVEEFASVGDYRVCEIDGAPLVVVRRPGGIAAMSAVCRHRLAVIAQGSGRADGYSCPYHGWTYDLEGRLIAAPRMPADFDRRSISLPEFPVETWGGFVYATLDPHATPLRRRLEPLAELLAPYHIERMRTLTRQRHVWRTNWKVIVENFLEPYHLNVTHHRTLATFAAPDGVTVLPRHAAFHFHRFRMLDTARPVPLDPRIGIPNPDLDDEGRMTAYIGGIFPSHVFSVTWDALFWMSLQPQGVDEVLVDVGLAGPFAIPPAETPDPGHPNLYYLGLIDAVNAEDRPRVESVQRGARSGLGQSSRLHPHEAQIAGFIAYLDSRLALSGA
jgi:phenylpropionate dioxygenase-like ring-hydroxylating dioxygenase large terminal subunit